MENDMETMVKDAVDDEQAGLEAAADGTVARVNLIKNMPYTVEFEEKYSFNGKEVGGVDLSGLCELTTADAEYVERVMSKLNHHPRDKFRDTTYTKHIAMRVTGYPVEFFNMLKWKDMQGITSRIAIHFLF